MWRRGEQDSKACAHCHEALVLFVVILVLELVPTWLWLECNVNCCGANDERSTHGTSNKANRRTPSKPQASNPIFLLNYISILWRKHADLVIALELGIYYLSILDHMCSKYLININVCIEHAKLQ